MVSSILIGLVVIVSLFLCVAMVTLISQALQYRSEENFKNAERFDSKELPPYSE